jgi:exonuclease III
MKLATFNVNNVNKRLVNLLDWLDTARPDVACLQELKAKESEFPVSAINTAGYSAVWRGQSHGMAWPSSRVASSPSSRAPRCPATLRLRKAATSKPLWMACFTAILTMPIS